MLFGTQTVNSRGHLEIGGCDVVDLADRYGTPLYVMDEALIRQNCRDYLGSFRSRYANTDIAFAGKAFLTTAMCRIVEQEGLCLDVASAGEMYIALNAGFPADRLFLHGNMKTQEELEMALDNGVGRIVVDNLRELQFLNGLAVSRGVRADILIRVAPGVDPHTHKLISTGQDDTKFGFNVKDGSALNAAKTALQLPGISLMGIHCHVGSQLLDTEAHKGAMSVMVGLAREILDQTGHVITEINTGGGLGIRYVESQHPPTIDEFAGDVVGALDQALKEHRFPSPRLIQEPGRSIVGTAGVTLYRVGAVKRVPIPEDPGFRIYVAIDGGLSDNPRPLLYDAVYTALVANHADRQPSQTVTICGKHCETDTVIMNARIAEVKPDDILAVQCTGAYNYSMASNYNRLTRPAVVLVGDGRADIVVERETLEDLVRHDVLPERLR